MKNRYKQYCKIIMLTSVSAFFMGSCSYKKIADAPYPNQVLYLAEASVASATNGIYTIVGNTASQTSRFIVDNAGKKFNVPLGVIRSGIDKSGALAVDVKVNTDTVAKMITAGKLPAGTELLPAAAYAFPNSIAIDGEQVSGSANMVVDLAFLTANINLNKKYAIGVTIVSNSSTVVNPLLDTTVIFISPDQVILPVSNFTNAVDNSAKKVDFINVSQNGVSYSWNFGDATAVETGISPSHKYAASGTFAVTLTVTGIAGAPSVKTTNVVIL
jgi:hypothetical protein